MARTREKGEILLGSPTTDHLPLEERMLIAPVSSFKSFTGFQRTKRQAK